VTCKLWSLSEAFVANSTSIDIVYSNLIVKLISLFHLFQLEYFLIYLLAFVWLVDAVYLKMRRQLHLFRVDIVTYVARVGGNLIAGGRGG